MRHRLRTSRRPSTRSAAVALCLVGLSALVVGPHAAIAQKQAGGPAASPEPTPAPKSAGTTGPTLTVLERRWQVDDLVASDVPTVEEGVVALRDENHDLHAFDAGSGEPLWQAASDAGEPLSFIPVARSGLALVLEQPEGVETARLRALDLQADRTERWAVEFDHATGLPYGRPVFTDDGLIVVAVYRAEDATRPEGEQGEAHGFVVLDRDGSERMALFPTDCFAVGGDLVVAPMDTFLGGPDTPRGISAREAATGEERWFLEEQVDDCPVVAGEVVLIDLFADEELLAVDAATGEERWRVMQQGIAPAAVDQGVVYVPRTVVPEGHSGVLIDDLVQIVALDLADGGTRWVSVPLEGRPEQIESAGGRVYVAQSDYVDVQGALRILDSGTGREVGRFELSQMGVTLGDDMVYTVSWDPDADDQGVLRAFDVREVPWVADLPAMVLTPSDLAEVGLEGHAVGSVSTVYGAEVLASWEGDPSYDVLEGAGLRRRYDSALYWPAVPEPGGSATSVVTSYITEFAHPEGAAAAFEVFEDESASATARDLEVLRDLGDGSEVTADEGEDPGTGSRYALLDLTIRRGNLHVGVSVVDWSGGEPSIEDVEALGERLLERVSMVFERPVEGIGNRVLRLSGERVVTDVDRYLVQEGVPIPAYGQEVAPAEEPIPALAVYEPSAVYEVRQRIDGSEASASYIVRIRKFLTQEAAVDAHLGVSELLQGAGLEGLAIEEVAGLGDEAFTYSASQVGASERYRGVEMRIGTDVAALEVIAPGPIDAAMVDALARAQATCLLEGCLEPLPVPAGLAP